MASNARRALAFASILIASAGCGSFSGGFTPRSITTAHLGQTAQIAVLVYEGDVERLKSIPGTQVIGEIEVRGRADMEDVAAFAKNFAAEHGATHIAPLGSQPQQRRPAYAAYLALRVPRDAWDDLPEGMLPAREP